MMQEMVAGHRVVFGAVFGVVVTACTSNAPPEIHDLADQVASVGAELIVNIDGSDPDGGPIMYGVHSDVDL